METPLYITALNDFDFCPVSGYFHELYGELNKTLYQSSAQLNGTAAHAHVDHADSALSDDFLYGIDVYSEQYDLVGKIDVYDRRHNVLTERKKHVKVVYDGYIMQLYGQCFAMREMGYAVDQLRIYSIDDHCSYTVPLPEDAPEKMRKFEDTIHQLQTFDISTFHPSNIEKCQNCIYEPYCDRSLLAV